jgi:carbamoyl-phosphate synthase large subunit
LEVKPGDKLENPKYGRLRPGHFIVGADTYEEAQQAAADVLKHVYVSFEE